MPTASPSTSIGTATPEEVAAANPHGRNFFQLYMWTDRDRSMDVLDRAAAAGFDTLLVTVDVPVAGARLRDRYNGLTIPPTLTGRTVFNAIPKVRWWFDFLTTEPLGFSTFKEFDGTVAELLDVDVGELLSASEILGAEELEQSEDPFVRAYFHEIVEEEEIHWPGRPGEPGGLGPAARGHARRGGDPVDNDCRSGLLEVASLL